MVRDKTASDFLAALEVIDTSLEAFHQRKRQMYRPLATELRKLLCDGASTLLPRVFENVQFHKLESTEQIEQVPSPRLMPSYFTSTVLFITDQVTRSTLRLARSGARLGVEAWLEQPFMTPQITIREFIRSVADKEGAHADPSANDTLQLAGSIHYGADQSQAHEIAAIAEYIAEFVRNEELCLRPGIALRRPTAGGAWELLQ